MPRIFLLTTAGLFLMSGAGAALAEDEGMRPAAGLKTVTSGECDGRTAALEVVRSDSVEEPALVTAILDGQRQSLQPEGPFQSLFTQLNRPVEINLVCTRMGVIFEFSYTNGARVAEIGGEPHILSRTASFGLNWPVVRRATDD